MNTLGLLQSKLRPKYTAIAPYYRVMHASKSQDDKSWGIGVVLFAFTKSWQISQSALRSLILIAFRVKTGAR